MNEELDRALVADFPKLYRQRGGDIRDTCMCWGFECADGWEPLIRELSAKLEFLNDNTPTEVEATQVKEKFGTLRFYTGGIGGGWPWADIVFALIDETEQQSAHVCEQCGKPGYTSGEGWLRTLCDKCQEAKP
ncbi:MAG: hypothetical protein WC322_05705 [Candidatus Paceibacterota bacterium]|jgi:hypothetical protein